MRLAPIAICLMIALGLVYLIAPELQVAIGHLADMVQAFNVNR